MIQLLKIKLCPKCTIKIEKFKGKKELFKTQDATI
jgi:hypothetical protein